MMHMQNALQTWRLVDLPHMDIQHHYLLQWNPSETVTLGTKQCVLISRVSSFQRENIIWSWGSVKLVKVSNTDNANTNTLWDTQAFTRSRSLQICTKTGHSTFHFWALQRPKSGRLATWADGVFLFQKELVLVLLQNHTWACGQPAAARWQVFMFGCWATRQLEFLPHL